MVDLDLLRQESPFKMGAKNEAYQTVFTGQSYLEMLAQAPDGQVAVANVTFEPGCRNHWHVHVDGYQILLVIGGTGWYQEEGKPARLLTAGDVVVTEKGIKHWHGATKDSWFEHIAITSGKSEFYDAVSDDEYAKLDEG
ncbi:cupin domain-containing protein [Streptococcus respiraculi]|uniref:cupin domain-containing protein n=1 Tax=Streptococcus respiraculi TaxID=2021971 RepID=UPI000E76F67F|nr:cupin domain-containing protein [Streptococcus respiraculi]